MVGCVGVAELAADAVAAEGVGLVGHHVHVDVHRAVGQLVGIGDGLLDRLCVLQPALLLVGELPAGGLEAEEVLDVALHRRTVGLVAIARRDAVGVADEVGVADQQGVALGLGEAVPPGVDGVGVAAEALQLGGEGSGVDPARAVGGGLPLGDGVDGAQCRDRGVLVGPDAVAPGDEVGLVGVEAALEPVGLHPERGDVVLGGLDPGEQRLAVLVERRTPLRQVDVL